MLKQPLEERAIIRDRGQLTIPDKLREILPWLSVNSVVTFYHRGGGEVVIRPFEEKRPMDWERIWSQVDLSRSFKGSLGNLSKAVFEDRVSH